MISYVKGRLSAVEDDRIIVEAGPVGLAVHVPLSLFDELPKIGEEIMVYTYFQVREDAMTLYGFLHKQDRDMFRQLLGVSGIGPKGALGILSAMKPDALRLAILAGDAKAISKAPGVGSKTAQRLILDLKDKVSLEASLYALGGNEEAGGTSGSAAGLDDAGKEAAEALMALGYTQSEAAGAVRKVDVKENMTAEEVLKASLRYLTIL